MKIIRLKYTKIEKLHFIVNSTLFNHLFTQFNTLCASLSFLGPFGMLLVSVLQVFSISSSLYQIRISVAMCSVFDVIVFPFSFLLIILHKFSIGFKLGVFPGHGSVLTLFMEKFLMDLA